MARQKWRGGAMLAPLPPAIVSCADGERQNLITVAWTGILSTVPPRTYISVRPSRFSHDLIERSGEFVINLCTADLARAADYCGMYTGAKVNKFEKCRLTAIPSTEVSCPGIAESPLSLECRVFEVKRLGSHDMYLADIVAVTVDDALLDANGKLRLDRADLCAYAHGEYFALGRRLGKFGFSAVK
ncbi:MAG: flavin reductase family protein [Clostridia bacterium]|nr:flavin reductase family protein [Clostridia bacterium]